MAKFRDTPDIRFRRQRSTSAAGVSPQLKSKLNRNNVGMPGEPIYSDTKIPSTKGEQVVSGQQADETFVTVASVLSKIGQVIDIARNAPRAEFIPVDSSATQVVQAVVRRDRENSPNGDKIFWGLFEQIISHAVNANDFINFEFLDSLHNEPNADTAAWNANRIANDIRQEMKGIVSTGMSGTGGDFNLPQTTAQKLRQTPEDEWAWLRKLMTYAAPLIYIYFDYKLKGVISSIDDAGRLGGKLPPGTEYTTIIIQIIVGIMIYMMLHGLSKEKMAEMMDYMGMGEQLKSRGIDIDLNELIDNADALSNGETVLINGQRHNLNTLPLGVSVEFFRNAMVYMGQADWVVLRDYCVEFLINHLADNEYYPWHMYLDAKLGEKELGAIMKTAPTYSPLFHAHAVKNNVTINQGGTIKTSDESYPLPGRSATTSQNERTDPNAYVQQYGKDNKIEASQATPPIDDKAQTWSDVGKDIQDSFDDSISFNTGNTMDDYDFWKMMTLDNGDFGYTDWKGGSERYAEGQRIERMNVETGEPERFVLTANMAAKMNSDAEAELRSEFQKQQAEGGAGGLNSWAWGTTKAGREGVQRAKDWVSGIPDRVKLDQQKNEWMKEVAWVWNNIVESLVANLTWQDWYKEFLCCFVRAAAFYNPTFLVSLKELLKWASVSMTVDIGKMLNKLYAKYWVGMMEEFKGELHAMLDEQWQKFIDGQIRPFIDSNIEGEIGEFCFLWKMMLESIIGAMLQFKVKMDAIIDDLFARLTLTSNLFDLKIKVSLGIKQIDMFAKLLDLVIDFAENCGVQTTEESMDQLESWLNDHGLSTFDSQIPTGTTTDTSRFDGIGTNLDGVADQLAGALGISDTVLTPGQKSVPVSSLPAEQRPHNVITAYGHEIDLPVQYNKATPTNSWWFGKPMEYDYSLVVMPVSALLERKFKDEEFAEEQQRRCRDELTPARMMAMVQGFPRDIVSPRAFSEDLDRE